MRRALRACRANRNRTVHAKLSFRVGKLPVVRSAWNLFDAPAGAKRASLRARFIALETPLLARLDLYHARIVDRHLDGAVADLSDRFDDLRQHLRRQRRPPGGIGSILAMLHSGDAFPFSPVLDRHSENLLKIARVANESFLSSL